MPFIYIHHCVCICFAGPNTSIRRDMVNQGSIKAPKAMGMGHKHENCALGHTDFRMAMASHRHDRAKVNAHLSPAISWSM